MDENNETESTNEALTPEEVLERAKKENEKFGDERQRGRLILGHYAGFIATEFAAVVVLLVLTFVRDTLPTEIYVILFTGIAAQNIAQACVCTKKLRGLYIATAVIVTAGALLYWVLWILELCGVYL